MTENRNIENEISAIITASPQDFTIGEKHLRLFPVTLAKTFVLKPHLEAIKFNNELLSVNPYMEALRVVEKYRETCASILAIHTAPNTYDDLFDTIAYEERRNIIASMSIEDMATLLSVVLSSENVSNVMRYLGITKERERLRQAIKIKNTDNKNSKVFGGVSVFGNFIGKLLEIGFSNNEIRYELPLSYLTLVLADKTVEVYFNDEELEKLPPELGGTYLDGNSEDSFDALKSQLAGKGVKFKE